MLESTAGGEPHAVSDVLLNWPLHIVGGGASPVDTVIQVSIAWRHTEVPLTTDKLLIETRD